MNMTNGLAGASRVSGRCSARCSTIRVRNVRIGCVCSLNQAAAEVGSEVEARIALQKPARWVCTTMVSVAS